MSEIKQGEIGAEANYSLSVVDGKLKLAIKYDGKQADAELAIMLDGSAFLDKLAAAIPGKIDDMVINAIKGALK